MSSSTRTLLSRGTHADNCELTKSERESLVRPYLNQSTSSKSSSTKRFGHRATFALYFNTILHRLLFHLIQLAFTFYIALRQTYHSLHDRLFSILYYHHRTPELIQQDVRNLSRLPKHLSIILSLDSYASTTNLPQSMQASSEALTSLLTDTSSLCAWSACASIPTLSIYERTGLLKAHIPELHRAVSQTLATYFPPGKIPSLHIRAPDHPAYSPPSSPSHFLNGDTTSHSIPHAAPPTSSDSLISGSSTHLNLLLLSATDGRDTLIDLTKTLTEMSQKGKLRAKDISAELIDAELTAASCGEPDLLVLMAAPGWKGEAPVRRRSKSIGKRGDAALRATEGEVLGGGAGGDVCLMGYPPWQVRLTEIL
jgi:dehydrodolichyl diphosphate syntase complex subunit NUS1